MKGLSSQQMKALLERVILRGSKGLNPSALQRGVGAELPPQVGRIPVGGTLPTAPTPIPANPYLNLQEEQGLPRYLAGEEGAYRGVSPTEGFATPGPYETHAGKSFRDPTLSIVNQIRAGALRERLTADPNYPWPEDFFPPTGLPKKGSRARHRTRRVLGKFWPAPERGVEGVGFKEVTNRRFESLPSDLEQLLEELSPKEVKLGRLVTPLEEGVSHVEDLPYELAREKYLARPEGFKILGRPPSVKRLRPVEPGGPEDVTGELKAGLAYEKLKWPDLLSGKERKGANLAKEVLGPVQGEIPLKKAVEEGRDFQNTFGTLWKRMGGRRTSEGKTWEAYMRSSRLSSKFKDPREYFISSGARWQANKAQFQSRFPRESKTLDQMWSRYME